MDVKPNYRLEQLKLKAQLANLHATTARQELEIMEMLDRKERLDENLIATRKAVIELEGQLDTLQTTHGAFTSQEFDAARQAMAEN